MRSYDSELSDNEPAGERGPSSRVWASAVAGLLGLGSAACGGNSQPHVDPDPSPIDGAVVPPDMMPDAVTSKITSETLAQYTFAELTAMCDARGGYTEIHAQCSGTNTCAGFSYGDWGDEATLIEHSCNAVSGCNGIGCVVLPPDSGKSALDILSVALPDTESVAQRACNYCHATWNDDYTEFDPTKFRVHVTAESGRTLANWLDRTPEQMARMIAFGSHGQYINGAQYGHMAGYYKMYSRAEIERVVAYVRTQATPVLQEIKVADPVAPGTARRSGRPRTAGRATAVRRP